MAKKLRKMGDIMHDMEDLLLEMTCNHDMQWYEVLNLVKGHLEVHCPHAQEEYVEGGHPVFFYGPAEKVAKNKKKKSKK
jgi:hypothetical protein